MARILVTGSNGQLGRELRLVAARAMDASTADLAGGKGAERDLEWIFTDFAELDITNRGAVETFFDEKHPDVIVNCAAYTDVDRAETERDAAFRINRDGALFLAEAAFGRGASLVHISTDFVFGRNEDGGFSERSRPYTEDDVPAPLNVYGESKLAGERAVLESGCAGAIVRTSWLYSPWGRNFVKSIIAAAEKRDEIRVVADQWGCPTSATSLAGAIGQMIPALISEPRAANVYHYCDTGVVSRSEFAAGIIKQANIDCRVVPVTSAEYSSAVQRPAYSALDTSRIICDFGVVPPLWQDALAECINSIKYGC